ncbi:hypothetical protein [Streptomyces sp. NPDC089795]|uniref:hypothetical protein n=1 Tax=Streptomyces sp. NPDC089795 TaxID=3155297 RepID=UPI00341F6D3F
MAKATAWLAHKVSELLVILLGFVFVTSHLKRQEPLPTAFFVFRFVHADLHQIGLVGLPLAVNRDLDRQVQSHGSPPLSASVCGEDPVPRDSAAPFHCWAVGGDEDQQAEGRYRMGAKPQKTFHPGSGKYGGCGK